MVVNFSQQGLLHVRSRSHHVSRVARGQAGEKRAGGAVGVGVDAGNDAVNGGRSIARAVQLNGAVGVDHRSRSGPVRCVPRSRCHRRRDGGIRE